MWATHPHTQSQICVAYPVRTHSQILVAHIPYHLSHIHSYLWSQYAFFKRNRLSCSNSAFPYTCPVYLFWHNSHGVSQGSVLRTVLFINYINSQCNTWLASKVTSFADYLSLTYGQNILIALNNDPEAMWWWFQINHLQLSTENTKYTNLSLRKVVTFTEPIIYNSSKCILNSYSDSCFTHSCSVVSLLYIFYNVMVCNCNVIG